MPKLERLSMERKVFLSLCFDLISPFKDVFLCFIWLGEVLTSSLLEEVSGSLKVAVNCPLISDFYCVR